MKVESKIDKLIRKSLNITKIALVTAAVASISSAHAAPRNSDAHPCAPQHKCAGKNPCKGEHPDKKKEHSQYPHRDKDSNEH